MIIKDLIEEVSKDFNNHLQIAGNDRIFFSGKFGKGKTTFLQEFFREKEEDYTTIFLDPVHYSIASTEDVQRYIKYDILISLLSKGIVLDFFELTDNEAWMYYLAKHPNDLIKQLLKFIPKIGKSLHNSIQGIQNLNTQVQNCKSKINQLSDEAKISNFIDEVESDPYSIYENDIITQIIRKILESISSNGELKRKTVLIIDNLDRIDPDHIFRILNIFSAHIDHKQHGITTNKFHFDHVIIVADMQNIKRLYHYRYGPNADATGYFDKFISKEIFFFQNYQQISEACDRILSEVMVHNNRTIDTLFKYGYNTYGTSLIIKALIYQNQLSLRQLFQFHQVPIHLKKVEIQLNKHFTKVESSMIPLFEMDLLTRLMGGFSNLYNALQELIETNVAIPHFRNAFDELVAFELKDICLFNELGDKVVNFNLRDKIYTVKKRENSRIVNSFLIIDDKYGSEFEPSSHDFIYLYSKILQLFYTEKLIE
ncbi:MAG: hypothetical protein IBJ16_07005 [Chitinophagaceae bacterium]|nr:hypothetical protein [Chitinophagaceae bacterium]